MLCIDATLLSAKAARFDLQLCAVSDTEPLLEASRRLSAWQERGYAAEMRYMMRSSELLCHPRMLAPWAKSALLFLASYSRTKSPAFITGYGRVARYAWGADYHRVLKARLLLLMDELAKEFGPSLQFKIFSDAVPLTERALAERAGLGFVGKNTLLIKPGSGSFTFIAEVLTNLDVSIPLTPPAVAKAGECGSCTRCLNHCPTGALVSPYELDAGKCISYLSIEKRSALRHEERRALGEWIFGCDICQEVCPFNHAGMKQDREPDLVEFSPRRGSGGLLSLSEVLRLRTSGAFKRRFQGSAIVRARREGLLRNAAVVAANTAAFSVLADLYAALEADRSGMVRQHALWAIVELQKRSGAPRAAQLAVVEPRVHDLDAAVREEALALRETL